MNSILYLQNASIHRPDIQKAKLKKETELI